MGYTKHALKGLSWVASFRVATRGMSFLRTAIIARILSPSQFGLYGIASLLLTMIEILTETGINIVLVQTEEGLEKYLDTAWVVSIIRGIVIAGVIFLSSFWVAEFFHSPQAVPLLMLVAVVPLLRGFINPSIASFQKELQFNKEFYYRTAQFTFETLVTIILVVLYQSPIALIWGLVAGAAFEVIISFLFVKPLPKVEFHKERFMFIVSRGKWVTLAGIFQYFFQNGDNIVVGRILGTGALGIYDMAYKMAMLPITEISNVIVRVTFPVYVKIADDKERLRRAYMKTLLYVCLICLPVGAMFILFSQQVVLIILGSKWLAAAPVFQVLAIVGITQAIIGDAGALFLAKKKQEYTTINTLIGVIAMGVCLIPFTYMYGLVGAGWAVIVGSFVSLPVSIYFVFKLLK